MVNGKWMALFWISLAELLALSLWFSASVIVPELKLIWSLSRLEEAWISAAVPIGFVIGAFISSYFGIADRFNSRRIFALSAIIGGVINGLLLMADDATWGIALRILTGVTLAGVYPTAVKILTQWFPKNRGLAIGILIAALTLGSSLPHFVVMFFSDVNWKLVILTTTILAFIAAFIVERVLWDAPNSAKGTPFSFYMLKKVTTNKPVMLANYGYFGHMWELYAMWTWLPAFLSASFKMTSPQIESWMIALCSFLAIGIAGGIGCVAGGWAADRIGRSKLTIISMVISSICAVFIGLTFGHSIWLTMLVAVIWGVSVIADSAQFSAAVSEYASHEYMGTALTFQMCVGFLITIVSINLIPYVQATVGWEWAFVILSIGPVLGSVSMAVLKGFEKNSME